MPHPLKQRQRIIKSHPHLVLFFLIYSLLWHTICKRICAAVESIVFPVCFVCYAILPGDPLSEPRSTVGAGIGGVVAGFRVLGVYGCGVSRPYVLRRIVVLLRPLCSSILL